MNSLRVAALLYNQRGREANDHKIHKETRWLE
jgi:hypothetical protein